MKNNLPRILLGVIIIFLLIMLVVLYIDTAIRYADTPVKDMPMWVYILIK
jgi:hypothetical protein